LAQASGDIVLAWNLNTNIPPVPKILEQPADTTVPPGWPATFTVVASSFTNLSYQWYFNNTQPIAGATSATLVLWNVGPANAGYYSVRVVSADGQAVMSLPAALELGSAVGAHSYDKLEDLLGAVFGPAKFKGHKDFSSFPSVSVGTLGSQLINNFNSTTEAGEPVHAAVGGSSRWYLLNAASNGTLLIDTLGSSIATILSVYTGSDILSLTLVATDQHSAADGVHSLVRFQAVAGTHYLISVDGVNGATGNIDINWRMGTPPATGGPAVRQDLLQGATVVLQAGGTNSIPPPHYQWRLNGTNLSGATASTYTLQNIQWGQRGTYSVVISNLVGIVTNSVATVLVEIPLQIAPVISPNGTRFELTAGASDPVVLQVTTNFSTWSALFTNSNPNLLIDFLDTNAVSRTRGFYRLAPWP
jgi:hypothetical protein